LAAFGNTGWLKEITVENKRIYCSNSIFFSGSTCIHKGNGNLLVVPKCEAGRRSFTVQGASIFNKIPQHYRDEISTVNFIFLCKQMGNSLIHLMNHKCRQKIISEAIADKNYYQTTIRSLKGVQ